MKQLISAVSTLLAIIVFCCANTIYVGKLTDTTSEFISEAVSLAESGKWNEAQERCSQASEYWTEKSDYLGMVINHNISDRISEGLPSLRSLAKWQETAEFTAQASEMLMYLEHLKQMELPSLSNIF